MVDDVIILAGGSGTRLWPASVGARPKQFLDLGDGVSLLQRTVLRAVECGISGRLVIVTHKDQAPEAERQCAELDLAGRDVQVLAEPEARNTAPAIALGLAYLMDSRAAAGGNTVAVLPADHIMEPTSTFAEDLERAETLARDGRIVTFGVPPTSPETGYGYIEAGEVLGSGFSVKSFREKPDRTTAERYLAAENYFWNSGMFVFRLDLFWAELARFEPSIPETLSELASGDEHWEAEALLPLYRKLPKISVDYAVMERSEKIATVPAGFSWNDVGSWDQIAALGKERGRAVELEGQNNFVLSDLPVALCGVSDLTVVVQNGAVLVCRRGQAQLVKGAVDRLRADGRTDLL
jgi:mannose-1-phosphate guanylyltransferase/mannose-6-phosphate isomerase